MFEAGIPAEAISICPGAGAEIGGAILESYRRSMIFGGPQTIEQYAGNPRVQVHGPGYSKILLGEDACDNWEAHLDLMLELRPTIVSFHFGHPGEEAVRALAPGGVVAEAERAKRALEYLVNVGFLLHYQGTRESQPCYVTKPVALATLFKDILTTKNPSALEPQTVVTNRTPAKNSCFSPGCYR